MSSFRVVVNRNVSIHLYGVACTVDIDMYCKVCVVAIYLYGVAYIVLCCVANGIGVYGVAGIVTIDLYGVAGIVLHGVAWY